jgi:O-antigen/teichoic acid export membrane protein
MSAVAEFTQPALERTVLPRIEWAFIKGAAWSLLGSIASQALSLVSGLLVARTLGRDTFGAFGLIQGAVGMFGVFAGMGLGITATKYIAEFRDSDPAKASRVLSLVLITSAAIAATVSLAMCFGSSWIATSTSHRPDLAVHFRIASAMLFFTTMNGMQCGALAGFAEFRAIAASNAVRGVCLVALMIPACTMWHLTGAMWTMTAGMALSVLLSQVLLQRACIKHGVRFFSKPGRGEARVLWEFSVPAFVAGLFVSPIDWTTNTLLVRQPHGFSEMGLLAAANQWRSAITFFPTTMGQPLLSHLSTLRSTGNTRRYFRLVYSAVGAAAALCGLLAAALILLESKLISLYGPSFANAVPVFRITVLAACLNATGSIAGQVVASAGRMWLGLGLNSVWAVTLLIGSFILIPRYGATGLASANLIAYGVLVLLACLFVFKVQCDLSRQQNTYE